jgi:AhpD family alkylhydroperoxidase
MREENAVSASSPARLAPLPADRWDDEVTGALAGMLPRWRRNPVDAGNALSTLVNHPALTKAFLPFNVHLLFASTLPPRLRELAILRVAHTRACDYEWTHHLDMGRQTGLSESDIAAAAGERVAAGIERAVLAAVDELDDSSRISDATWAALGEELDDRQRMDLVFTVGTYATLAMAFNTFGVQLDDDHEG